MKNGVYQLKMLFLSILLKKEVIYLIEEFPNYKDIINTKEEIEKI